MSLSDDAAGAVVPLALVRSYDELHAALRERAAELGISRLELDAVAGLAHGHAGKILGLAQVKKLGPVSMPLVLEALAVRLALIEDAQALQRLDRVPRRRRTGAAAVEAQPVSMATADDILREHLRELSRRGVEARKRLPAERRSELASIASRARWKKARA